MVARTVAVSPPISGRAPQEAGHECGEALNPQQLIVGLCVRCGVRLSKTRQVEQGQSIEPSIQQGGIDFMVTSCSTSGVGPAGELGRPLGITNRSRRSSPGKATGRWPCQEHANSGPGFKPLIAPAVTKDGEGRSGPAAIQRLTPCNSWGRLLQGAGSNPSCAGPDRSRGPDLQARSNRADAARSKPEITV